MISFRAFVYPVLLVSLLLVSTYSLYAGLPMRVPPPRPGDHSVIVTAVDPAKKQITVTNQINGHKQVYLIDDLTKVIIVRAAPGSDRAMGLTNGNVVNSLATIKDIKVRQQVFDMVERDEYSLDSITVSLASLP